MSPKRLDIVGSRKDRTEKNQISGTEDKEYILKYYSKIIDMEDSSGDSTYS